MKGIALIGMILALLLVLYLTLANLKSKPASQIPGAEAAGLNGQMTELPGQVKSKLETIQKQSEDQLKAAEEAMK